MDVPSAIICQLLRNGPPRAIEHLGNEPTRHLWLPAAASGESLFCIAITEPDSGSAVHRMRARPVADGSMFRLEAYKNYVTGGHVADACLVWCRFPGGTESRCIGAVVVDLGDPDVSVVGNHRQMGHRGCSEAELAFDGVHIEPEDVLVRGDADSDGPFRTLLSHLHHKRCGNAAFCLGAAQGALEMAVAYMNDRRSGASSLAQQRDSSGRSPTWPSSSNQRSSF